MMPTNLPTDIYSARCLTNHLLPNRWEIVGAFERGIINLQFIPFSNAGAAPSCTAGLVRVWHLVLSAKIYDPGS